MISVFLISMMEITISWKENLLVHLIIYLFIYIIFISF